MLELVRTSPCRLCGRPIAWCRLPTDELGLERPLDPDPVAIMTGAGVLAIGRTAHRDTCAVVLFAGRR